MTEPAKAERNSKFIGVYVSPDLYRELTNLQHEISKQTGAVKPVALSEVVRRALVKFARED